MDYDINNQQMLRAGATAQSTMRQMENWRPMGVAPRDGTVIEVRNTYGVAPSYQLVRWTVETKSKEPSWVAIDANSGGSPAGEGAWLMWRPFDGEVSRYVDPTGGAQNNPAYWRGAVARERGLPLNYFEKDVILNTEEALQKPRGGFWSWLFGK